MFGGNSAFGASVSLVSLGALLALLQQLWNHVQTLFDEYFSISLEIPNSDTGFGDILAWLIERQMTHSKRLSLRTDTVQAECGKLEKVHDFRPNVGIHKFKFLGKKFKIVRKRQLCHYREEDEFVDIFVENLVISSAFASSIQVFRDMLAEVGQFKAAKSKEKTRIYVQHPRRPVWIGHCSRRKRPVDSVILDDAVAEPILADIQDFRDSAQWYTDFGVPYRRGYLLHGPPGTGKTSFIAAVAGHFDLNICMLNLSDKGLTDASLNQLVRSAPWRSIIVLEDVDAAFGNRDDRFGQSGQKQDEKSPTSSSAFDGMNRLTFSGLLNALDGVASAEGRILFMTTNHVDKLDPALVRPGRVDVKQHIGYATESQVERMFRRFYRAATDAEAHRFVREVFDGPVRPDISLAQMQGLLLRFKSDPAQIFTGLSMLYEKY